jgi:hypothetical protein
VIDSDLDWPLSGARTPSRPSGAQRGTDGVTIRASQETNSNYHSENLAFPGDLECRRFPKSVSFDKELPRSTGGKA